LFGNAGSIAEFVEGMTDKTVALLDKAGYAVDKEAKTITNKATGEQIAKKESIKGIFSDRDWQEALAAVIAAPEYYKNK